MEFFSPTSNVNFVGARRFSVAISIVLVIGSILALATRGLNFALDFTGGTLVEVNYDAPVEQPDRKSTRLNSQSLMRISYAVFCLKKKTNDTEKRQQHKQT